MTEHMRPDERLEYSPIIDRPKLKLPDGGRMIIWTIVNVEVWDSTKAQPRMTITPAGGGSPIPDIPNWAWHEYGNRIGFWRLMRVLNEFEVPTTLALNGGVCKTYPRIAEEALKSDWELMGHGFSQLSMQKVEDERKDIQMTRDAIKDFSGKQPRGWLSPALTETFDTVDILQEEGFEYVTDWVLDDQPVELKTRSGSLVNIPYTQENNDVGMMLIQHHKASEYTDRALDQFETLYEESADQPRVMALSCHPYIFGVPHRIKYFRKIYEELRKKPGVCFWTGSQILDWYLNQKQ
jgi:allantoinase|tara:strand:- start:162 stop:1043 length:882 start_codon:yes stop_codon:yes gene_type:complete